MHGIQFAYITCCYVRQASGKLSGCLEQPLFERYAYILIHYRSGLLALCQGKLNTWQNFNEYLMIVMCYECTPLCNMDGEHKERIQQTRGGTT